MYRIALNAKLSDKDYSVATIGSFDGLHRGHMFLLDNLNIVAQENNYWRQLITFEPLPLEYFNDKNKRQRLTRLSLLRDKFLILKQLDLVDELIILHFNTTLACLTPTEFASHVLFEKLHVRHMVLGSDFKFGVNGSGCAKDLQQAGMATSIVAPHLCAGQRISSSAIRDLASRNDLLGVRNSLGRNLQYTSRVVHGNKLGRELGVPTINLGLGKNRPALWGIYVAKVYIKGGYYNAVASIGKNPTVSEAGSYKLEAHLLDVDLDLYGEVATIEILDFLRHELKFDNLTDLVSQMREDLQNARNYFIDNQ